jgi:3-oxoacyl-(acyl-carrier-protein) synthase
MREIVVTGLGVVSTVGCAPGAFIDALLAGRSGITLWKEDLDARPYSRIGGDLTEFDLSAHLDSVGAGYPATVKERARKLLRSTPLSGRATAAAALHAFVDAGLREGSPPPERCAHVLAGHNLNANYIVRNVRTYYDDDPDYIDPLFGVMCMDTDVLAVTSQILGVRGPSFTVGGACASGNLAIQAALDLLRLGRADVALVCGGALDTDPVSLQGWAMIDAISCRAFVDEPTRASRPFDLRREGFVPAQGAAALVLEAREHAEARGARIHGRLLGAACTGDACRLTKPSRDGQSRAMRLALADARVTPDSVDYVNAHATSTPLGDAVEVAAIKDVFGAHSRRLLVNATKSMIGHNLAAAGVVEAVATLLQMQRGIVHPTINLEEPDPALDLDFVPNEAREHRIAIALSNSFGFGGLNSTVILGSAS